jgi:hypothetical protein
LAGLWWLDASLRTCCRAARPEYALSETPRHRKHATCVIYCALRGLYYHAPATAVLSLPLTLTGVCTAELGRGRDYAELDGAGRDAVGADRSLRR